jgi:hypothetical protein
VSLATGFVVFAIGASLFPVSRPLPPPPRPPVVAAPTPPPPPPAVDAQPTAEKAGDVATDAAAAVTPSSGDSVAANAGTNAEKNAPPAPHKKAEAAEAPEPAPKSASDASSDPEKTADASAAGDAGEATGPDGGNESDPDCTMAEKDIAREAWRRNWPTLCKVGDTGKAFILIPIKGSIDKANGDLKRKPVREARVTLPEAESQLTLKLYKLKRMGFKDLKIGPPEDGPGVRLRVRLLPGAGDPVFEIKDGYAKITVAMPDKE